MKAQMIHKLRAVIHHQQEILHCQLCKWQVQDGTITETKEFESARKTNANRAVTKIILMIKKKDIESFSVF